MRCWGPRLSDQRGEVKPGKLCGRDSGRPDQGTERDQIRLVDYSCLADWISRHSRQEIEARLAAEYRHGAPSHVGLVVIFPQSTRGLASVERRDMKIKRYLDES